MIIMEAREFREYLLIRGPATGYSWNHLGNFWKNRCPGPFKRPNKSVKIPVFWKHPR